VTKKTEKTQVAPGFCVQYVIAVPGAAAERHMKAEHPAAVFRTNISQTELAGVWRRVSPAPISDLNI
jgi:hypothetical protein